MSKNIHHFMAGHTILEFTYRVCADFAVPRSEIAELLTDLRDAVIIGQHDKPIPPDCHPEPIGNRIADSTVAAIHTLNAQQMGITDIACTLGIDYRTVKRYLTLGPTASLPEPQSDPASG